MPKYSGRFVCHCLSLLVATVFGAVPATAQADSNPPPPVLSDPPALDDALDEAPDDLGFEAESEDPLKGEVVPDDGPATSDDVAPQPETPADPEVGADVGADERERDAEYAEEAKDEYNDAADDEAYVDDDLPLAPDERQIDFMTPLWSAVGCAVCGVVPFAAALGLGGLGLLLVLGGIAEGGCGGAVGIIVGVAIAIFGLIPVAIGGVTAPAGSTAATALSRWGYDRPMLWPTLAAFLGVVSGLAGVLALTATAAATAVMTDNQVPEAAYIAVVVLLVAAVMGSLAAGPLAVAAGSATSLLVDAAEEGSEPLPESSATTRATGARSSSVAVSRPPTVRAHAMPY